jgi:hypothetical protein
MIFILTLIGGCSTSPKVEVSFPAELIDFEAIEQDVSLYCTSYCEVIYQTHFNPGFFTKEQIQVFLREMNIVIGFADNLIDSDAEIIIPAGAGKLEREAYTAYCWEEDEKTYMIFCVEKYLIQPTVTRLDYLEHIYMVYKIKEPTVENTLH